ncbi:MAG: HNH endonuclease [Synechococcus sp. SB0673_bin_10]|nr:HNH endonuclease [Synechococcus sp. SB0673_bin_10]
MAPQRKRPAKLESRLSAPMMRAFHPSRWPLWFWILLVLVGCVGLWQSGGHSSSTWNGLTIAPENRCSPYDRERQYPYSSKIEPRIVAASDLRPGKIYAPYSNVILGSFKDTDIEHIVAVSEAHDSGLCAASDEIKRKFANDLLNLTLATPDVNRSQKSDKDLADWQPENNQCWFLDRVVAVKKKYGLTIDSKEAEAMKKLAAQC